MSIDCDKWKANKNINPTSGRKILPTGKVYKALEKSCVDAAQNPKIDVCVKWSQNKTINPVTGRSIKEHGPVYKALQKQCELNKVSLKAKTPTLEKASSKPDLKKASSKPTLEKTSAKPDLKKASSKPTLEKASSKPTLEKASYKPTLNALQASSKPDLKKKSTANLFSWKHTPPYDPALFQGHIKTGNNYKNYKSVYNAKYSVWEWIESSPTFSH